MFNSKSPVCSPPTMRVTGDCLDPTSNQWVKMMARNPQPEGTHYAGRGVPAEWPLTPVYARTLIVQGWPMMGTHTVGPLSGALMSGERDNQVASEPWSSKGSHLLSLPLQPWEAAPVQQGLIATPCKAMGFCKNPRWQWGWSPSSCRGWNPGWRSGHGQHWAWVVRGEVKPLLHRALPRPCPGPLGLAGALASEVTLGCCPRRGHKDVNVAQVGRWWLRILPLWLLRGIGLLCGLR